MEAFDRAKTSYEQNFLQYRAMNQIMWQVPLLAMTLTGGLWFAVATVRGVDGLEVPLLGLSAVFNLSLILVLARVRYVMGEYLTKIKEFCPEGYVEAPGDRWYNSRYIVARAFAGALAVSAGFSLIGMVYFAWRITQC